VNPLEFPFIELLQHYGQSGRTGAFTLQSRNKDQGTVFLMSGFIAFASTGKLEGEHAVYEILAWDNPKYTWEEGKSPPETIMSGPVEELIVKSINAKASGELETIRREHSVYDKTRAINAVGHYRVTFEIFGGEIEPFEYEMISRQLRVGRQPDNDLVLSDGSISRKHALMILNKNSILVRDLGSMNGVKIDGQPLAQGIARNGQLISIGEVSLKVHFSPVTNPAAVGTMAKTQ